MVVYLIRSVHTEISEFWLYSALHKALHCSCFSPDSMFIILHQTSTDDLSLYIRNNLHLWASWILHWNLFLKNKYTKWRFHLNNSSVSTQNVPIKDLSSEPVFRHTHKSVPKSNHLTFMSDIMVKMPHCTHTGELCTRKTAASAVGLCMSALALFCWSLLLCIFNHDVLILQTNKD